MQIEYDISITTSELKYINKLLVKDFSRLNKIKNESEEKQLNISLREDIKETLNY